MNGKAALPAIGWAPGIRVIAHEGESSMPGGVLMSTETVSIRPTAFLRTMLTIAWECFRHPFSTSVVDTTTGRLLSRS